jgi:nucleoside 2-deoxyribosyltransferase
VRPKRIYVAGPPYADEYRRRASQLLRDAGLEPIDPMRRDFRGRTQGNEETIVSGDLSDIDASDGVLASFSEPDEGTAMEAWYAHSRGIAVVAYTGGRTAHPWTVYVTRGRFDDLEAAVRALVSLLSDPSR